MSEGFVTTGDGCRIAWRSDGATDAPAIILSNSLGTDLAMWEPQLATLARQFRVIRYDGRGHGRSDAPPGAYSMDRLGRDVVELADALAIERFSFCGLSMGGMVGQWLGWREPRRLERLVIANSSAFMGPPSAWDNRIEAVRAEGMSAVAAAVVERWFTAGYRQDSSAVANVVEMLLATPPGGYAGCCAAIRDMDMRPVLPLIEGSVLVIGGSEDPATPPAHSQLLAEGIGGARLQMLDAAHLSNQERPDAFNRALEIFLLA
jgi:3-oxoadipate enol-lactonase